MSGSINGVIAAVRFDSVGSLKPGEPQRASSAGSALADTVQLSEAQIVFQLYNQGEPVSQIASALGLSVAVVNSYLAAAA